MAILLPSAWTPAGGFVVLILDAPITAKTGTATQRAARALTANENSGRTAGCDRCQTVCIDYM